ncbi:MAG: hypothetical protein AVDCRST_MAG01-01-1387 [uncultured Rubrobacteraceae bacterium]|uniref:Uncharacterized protein n=1 Tax=uncultured Rubrobacteraceae bacterium TaxID=349277 RepID=A0A6J4P5S7_9ACTN|nr:MAG: hypothetical protein AVDCRST_MAG01-01-1387 [uncultured Rubrobacteraceae bacterium]
MTEEPRKATFDFRAFAEGVLEIPEPTQEDLQRARAAGAFLRAIAGTGGPPIDARYLMRLPSGIFAYAEGILSGEAADAASQAEAQEANPDGWENLRSAFSDLGPVTDPSIASAFI